MINAKPTSGLVPQRIEQAPLAITVLHTTVRPTLTALRRASSLAQDLGAAIRILSVRVVPYPLALEFPHTNEEVLVRNIKTIAAGQPIATTIEICYGRDIVDALLQSLPPNSIVVIGATRGWWPSKERQWAKQLIRRGHHVMVVAETSNNS